MTTGRAPVKSVKASAARAYGCALLTTGNRANGSATGNDGRRASLTTETRTPALRRSQRGQRRREDDKT
jgi:hypothetical protein